MFENNSIIITNVVSKSELLKLFSGKLLNIKVYVLEEFLKLYYFDYDKEAIYYIKNKYDINDQIAKIYLDNLYYIENKKYDLEKLIFLKNLKEELLLNNLLKKNDLFISSLVNKKIYLYNLGETKEIKRLETLLGIKNLVSIYNDDEQDNKHLIYELENIEAEVIFVANKICSLVKEGVSLSNIYITNLDDEYRKLIKKYFKMFNINVTLNDKRSIFGTPMVNMFFEFYDSDLSVTMNKLKECISTIEEEDIYNKLITIINNYTFISDKLLVYDMIKNDIKKTYKSRVDDYNSVHEIDFIDGSFSDENYVFLLSFNQTVIPVIKKDEDYLSDKEKNILGISLTVDLNKMLRKNTLKKIKNIKNLIITYKLESLGEEYIISNLNEDLYYKVEKGVIEYNRSNLYNKIKLTSLLDNYYKYGTKSQLLYLLNNHYKELDYLNYDHTFKGIKINDLKNYLNNGLTLSYTSLDSYYRCPFSFYLSKILKLDIYEENFYQLVGTLFHSILEKYNSDLNYDELWNKELLNLNKQFNSKEKFFLEKLKKELKFVIDTIKEQEKVTNLHDELHEERVYVSISGDIKITFTGIIDKIKYKDYGDKTIIAIIDYKTGNPNLDLTTIPYGIGMQLPIYIYLAKNIKKFKNIKVAGFYLEKILNNEINGDSKKNYEINKKKNLLLQGYSNSDLNVLKEFDITYNDSDLIKGMKVKKDNSFYSYSKVLSDKDIERISQIAETNVKEGANNIINAKFKISPKRINNVNLGCAFCKFSDICFHREEDIVDLEAVKLEDVLGCDNNGMDK